MIDASSEPASVAVTRIAELDIALVRVDQWGCIDGITSGLCRQLKLAATELMGVPLTLAENMLFDCAALVPCDIDCSPIWGASCDGNQAVLRVLPRIELLLNPDDNAGESWFLCRPNGVIIYSAAGLVLRPGGRLLGPHLTLFDLLPGESVGISNILARAVAQVGECSSLSVRLPNLAAIKISAISTDGVTVEVCMRPVAGTSLSLTQLINSPTFAGVGDLLAEGLSVHDFDGRTLYINTVGQQILRSAHTHGELLPLSELIHVDYRRRFAGLLAASLKGASGRAFFGLAIADGGDASGSQASCWIEVSSRPIRNSQGDFDRFVLVFRDCSAQRQLLMHTTRLSLAAERTSNMVCITDERGRVEWVNSSFERISGYCLDEIKGRTPGSFLQGPETDSTQKRRLATAIASNRMVTATLVNYARDGKPYLVALTVEPIFELSGAVSGFFALQNDVSEKVSDRNLLHRIHARRKLALASAGLGYWEYDRNSGLIHVSSELAEQFGLDGVSLDASFSKVFRRLHRRTRGTLVQALRDAGRVNDGRIDGSVSAGADAARVVRIVGRRYTLGGSESWVGVGQLVLVGEMGTTAAARNDAVTPPLQLQPSGANAGSLGNHDAVPNATHVRLEPLMQSLPSESEFPIAAKLIADLIPGGYVVHLVLKAGRIIEMRVIGEGFQTLHGFSAAEMMRSDCQRLTAPRAERERLMKSIINAAASTDSFEIEFVRTGADGDLLWSLFRGNARQDADGRTAVHGVVIDIDVRKRARLVLDERSQLVAAFADSVPDGGVFQIQVFTTGLSELSFASQNFGQLCPGFKRHAADPVDLLFADSAPAVRKELSRKIQRSCTQLTNLDHEFTIGVNESERSFVIRARPVLALGRVILNGLLLDGTERARSRRALAEREQILRNIGDNLPSGFVFQLIREANGATRFTYVSAGFEKLTGLPRQEVSISIAPLLRLFSASDALQFETRLRESMRRLVPLEFECALCSDGKVVFLTLQIAARPRPFSGGATLWEGVGLDVTARRRTDEEKRALFSRLEHKSTELESVNYALSHDLKGAVLSMRGQLDIALESASSLASDDVPSAAIVDRLKRAVDITDKMWSLLAQVLELSRMERTGLSRQRIPLGELIQPTLVWVASVGKQSRPPIMVESAAVELDCDVLRMQTVLMNLIGNAIKFSPPDAAPIVVGARYTDDGALLSVSDSGIGIEARYLERIFTLFERLDTAREGAGVGLALVRRVVEMHAGRIWATSDGIGHGTTFWVFLPRKRSAALSRPHGAR